ncbi:hypothetical protein [Paenibacillus germinis]|uniref:hypothetical protein n=1 Tax=Paenibacillus germinis TaxID=2654979 RepID=UPI001FE4F148|nr:hypothetical protein [Paenibacillus germinis]
MKSVISQTGNELDSVLYHQQVTEGNVIRNATGYIDRINYFHIADNPGRNQPGTGDRRSAIEDKSKP